MAQEWIGLKLANFNTFYTYFNLTWYSWALSKLCSVKTLGQLKAAVDIKKYIDCLLACDLFWLSSYVASYHLSYCNTIKWKRSILQYFFIA